MKVRKMISILTVVTMLTAFVIGGTGNVYANETQDLKKLELIEVLVADLSLSNTQKEKYADFRSSMGVKPVVKKQEKNMDFVNKLTTVMCF